MSQFKPGDMALTLKPGEALPAMTQVEIVCPLEVGRTYTSSKTGDKYTFDPGFWKVNDRNGDSFAYHESQLMPLRGDFEPEQQKAREAEPCL